MDRSFVAYPSQSQQQQQQQQSRRPKNDSFRPALRFPTDPHKPGSLPQKIQHIVAPAAPSAILLQSRRKPWEVDSTRLDDLVASTANMRKVIVVLGDAPTSALEPIVTSSYLSGSLVIVIASSECDFSIAPQKCVPAVRVLRVRPQPAVNPAAQKSQHQRAGSEAAAESQPHLSASRLNAVLNWAERVGSAWRANPVGQTQFATLQEGEGPADGIGGNGKNWKWRSKTKLTETAGYDLSDGDGSLVPWAARFALNSRSNTSSLASGSSNTSSIFIVETPLSDSERPSFSSSSNGKFVRNAMSTSNLASSDRNRSFDHALSLARRPGASHAGHRSVPPPAKDLTPPTAQKRRFSLISFARGKMTPDVPTSISKKAMRPSFDALINFLPPSSATGVDGALGRGAIATNHAIASHNKLLLKQTILVTTAAQRFLVPVALRGSGRSAGEGRFGGVTRGRASEGSGMNGEDRQAKKRWSVGLIGSLFGVGDPVPSAKALGKRSALPTPPVSRPSSSEESGGGGHGKRPSLGGRMVSSVSAMSASTQGPYPLPKLVHVLPFGPGHASTPAGPGSARLVRNLEAFLLSWSFGGPKFSEDADESGAEGSATFSSNASGKRTVRPFLLDLAGLTDVLKAQLPDGDVEWPLADLILSGALDDEYPCTGGSPASTPSVPTPDVVVTRASSDARSPTGSNFPHARTASGSKPKFGNDGLTLDSTPGPMEESWAARRAWLSGVGDLAIYPMAEGLGLTASPTTTSGSGPSLRPTSTSTSISERSRTRSLGGAAPPARPRVSIGGVSSSTPSPVASPQLQSPPPPVPSKIFAPKSSAPSTPAKSRTRINSNGRSPSSSNAPPVPALPPSPQETFGSPPPPSTYSGRSNFLSEQPRYARNPVPRPPQQSALDSEDRPARYYSVSDHGHGSSSPASRSPPSQSSGADLRRGKSGSASSAAPPSMSATPIAAAFSRMRDQEEFGTAPPPTSWNGTWGSASSAPSYQAPPPSASLPSRSSIKNSDYASQISHGRNPPTRGTTVPQSGGSWDYDSDVASPRPSVLRKKSIDDRDRRYGANTPPAPHPSFTSSPKYPGAGRRPSEDNQPYFNGYEIAPPPLPLPTPPPPRPTRAAPPSAGGKLERNRSTSSPLKNNVSAEGLNNHRSRPGTGGSVIDKRLPITPPDSASSSELSNDMDMGGRTSDREEKRRWWASPTKVSARLI